MIPISTEATLADVIARHEEDASLTPGRRRDLKSAVLRISEITGVEPRNTPASLRLMRPRINAVRPAKYHLTPKTWSNLRSNFRAAVVQAAPRQPRRPDAEWSQLRTTLPTGRMKKGLSRSSASVSSTPFRRQQSAMRSPIAFASISRPTRTSPTGPSAGRLYEAASRCKSPSRFPSLQSAQLRIANLAGLRLDRHLVRPGGPRSLWQIDIPAHEVKNDQALVHELPRRATAILDAYIRRFRPALALPGNPYLFPVGSTHKGSHSLSQQIRGVIADWVGIDMTPHQFRHFAGRLMQQHSPGAYAAIAQLLGHKDDKTTTAYYAELDTLSAGRQFDAFLEAELHNARLRGRRR